MSKRQRTKPTHLDPVFVSMETRTYWLPDKKHQLQYHLMGHYWFCCVYDSVHHKSSNGVKIPCTDLNSLAKFRELAIKHYHGVKP